jgi:5-methylcytosine-specific restriction endonuclease McrA
VPQRTCEECGAPFAPRAARDRRCRRHELRGRAHRSPTTRAQDAEYAAERARVLVPGARCHWCGEPATTVDHLHPVARGAQHAGNLVPACAHCNFSRKDRLEPPAPRVPRFAVG